MNASPPHYDELECLSWLSQLLDPSKFDLVVPVERKATAILRTLLDLTPGIRCEWKWTKVLSSEALRYLPRDRLRGQRILVFNEMIHHGSSTLDAIKAIEDNTSGASAQVYTAAFFVHEDFKRDHVCARRALEARCKCRIAGLRHCAMRI